MKATTIAGLVTPHLFKVVDLAKQAETGANVDFHLRETVARTISELAQQYNARDLCAAYIQGLESAFDAARKTHRLYARELQVALQAARGLEVPA